jgi:flagellar biosynthesis regulator FlaF
MRLSEFWTLMEQEFGGAYGRSVAASHVIHAMDDRTATEAIEAGEPVRRVWLALCEDLQVPPERRFVADRSTQRRR